MSGRRPPSYCTFTLSAMQEHQQKGRQTNTSSNNKDKSNTIIIETSTAEDHDDENLHNPSTRPRYSPGSRRRAVGDHTAVDTMSPAVRTHDCVLCCTHTRIESHKRCPKSLHVNVCGRTAVLAGTASCRCKGLPSFAARHQYQ